MRHVCEWVGGLVLLAWYLAGWSLVSGGWWLWALACPLYPLYLVTKRLMHAIGWI